MKTAFSCWHNRIAPVFDETREIHVVETASGHIRQERREQFPHDLPIQKALYLADRGVNTLICGAISRTLHGMVAAYGINVIPFIAGDLARIVQAWAAGDCDWNAFAMPGCRGQGRHRRRKSNIHYQEGKTMNNEGRGRRGSGQGQGKAQGQGSRRSSGTGRGSGTGQTANCICPQCGQKEAHQRGVPCFERTCPKCSATMTRE